MDLARQFVAGVILALLLYFLAGPVLKHCRAVRSKATRATLAILLAFAAVIAYKRLAPPSPPDSAPNPALARRVSLPFTDGFERLGQVIDTGWFFGAGETATITDTDAHSGRRCLRIVGPCTLQLYFDPRAYRGDSLEFSAWVKPIRIPPPDREAGVPEYFTGHCRMTYESRLQGQWQWCYVPPADTARYIDSVRYPEQWVEKRWRVNLPNDARNLHIFVGVQQNVGTLLVDDVRVERLLGSL